MKNYLSYLIIKCSLSILYILPLEISLVIGKILGFLVWCLSNKQKRISYKNLKAAFYNKKDIKELKKIIWSMYQHLGLSFAEIARFAKLDKEYLNKYMDMEGLAYANREKEKKKGIIFLTAHFGNWELSSQVASLAGYRTKVLARQQKITLIDKILNKYRSFHGCAVVTKGANLKVALRTLRNKENLGMLADEDVKKGGIAVNFFGRTVLASPGPMSIAYRTKCPIILSFLRRARGPYHKFTMRQSFYIKTEDDIQKGLQFYCDKLSDLIKDYPEQWLWLQKRWCSSREHSIVVLSDNKAGHLNQSMAVASWLKEELNKRGLRSSLPYQEKEEIKTLKPSYRYKCCPVFLNIALKSKLYKLFPEKLLGFCLTGESFCEISAVPVDYLISCGNSLSALNVIIKYINLSKNIIIMKPALPISNFDLAVIPAHDGTKAADNVVITRAAPNIINRGLRASDVGGISSKLDRNKKTLSLFFGGDTRFFKYQDSFIEFLILTLKKICDGEDLNFMITTSRRTSKSNELIFKNELDSYNKCKYLIIANEENPPGAVVSMLAVSNLVLVTFDSVSMISEAASSDSHVVVILPDTLDNLKGFTKHKKLIRNFVNKGFVSTATINQLESIIRSKLQQKEKNKVLSEEFRVKEALSKIL